MSNRLLPASRRLALAFAASALAASAGAQTVLLSDSFDGTALNATNWASGSTGSLGTATVGSGNVVIDVNQEANGARMGLASQATTFNPFASPLTVELSGLALGGNPASSFTALYALVGRLPTDTGGAATGALASTYSAGGAYGAGGALGISLLGFSTSFRLQILDSGSNATVQQTQVTLSGAPTGMVWSIDGANSTWSVTLVGATFSSLLTNQLGVTLAAPGAATISGTFSNFTETGLTVGEDIISRFVLGANNGTSVTDGAIATFGDVVVTSAIPEPSAFAAIAGLGALGCAALRRRRGSR